MAKNNFTFQTAIKLNSAGFKKGVADVKSAIAGLKSSFLSLAGALGAGLGFTQLISNLKDTAVQLSVAKSTLENVSKVTKDYTDGVTKGSIEISNYGDNLNYVRRLAKDYSQDLVGLIENFAQFHAACTKTNLDLENQKLVFESLTKAAAYYHMSAERSRDMMNAITQMMSKGKVSAEELRRQLGNALPGAFNLMAAAMGVTTAQLEDMMKKGQVISSEVLPKFAAMLNTVTKNANFDSIQMSINKLKNTWVEFVENSGAEQLFNGVVNGANNVLSVITRNIDTISSLFKGLIVGIVGAKIWDNLIKEGNRYYTEQKTMLEKAQRDFKAHIAKHQELSRKIRIDKTTGIATPASIALLSEDDKKLLVKYNEGLIRLIKLEKEINGNKPKGNFIFDDGDITKIESINKEILNITNNTVNWGQKAKGVGTSLIFAFKSLGKTIAAAAASMWQMALVGAILGGITAIIDHVKQVKEEWKRINGLVDEYHQAVKDVEVQTSEQEKILISNLNILSDISKGERARLGALKEINKLIGSNFTKDALDKTSKAYEKIVSEVYRWIDATKIQARIQVQAQKAAEAQSQIEKIKVGLVGKENSLRELATPSGRDEYGNPVYTAKRKIDTFKVNSLKKEIKQDKAEIKELTKIVNEADSALNELGIKLYEVIDTGGNSDSGNSGDTESDISKVFDKWTKEKNELGNKLKEHAITQEEYNDELDKLVLEYWKSAAGTGKMSIDDILNKMDKGKTLTAMEKWYSDLYEAAKQAAFNATLKAAGEAIGDGLDEAIKEADDVIQKGVQDYVDRMERAADSDIQAILTNKPTKQKRSNTFDYNKSKSDILEEESEISSKYADEIEDAINDIVSSYENIEDASDAVKAKLAEWRKELSLARKEAETLQEAMKFAKIQEDIDELENSINSMLFNGLKNGAQSLDRVIKGMESLRDVMESTDSTGWEKFMAVFNELVQIVETCVSAFQTLDAIQEATNKKEQAELSLQAEKVALLEREIALREALRMQRVAETKETEKAAAANLVEASTARASASAKASEAVAGATASGSKLPFPYNLAAIAGGIAAVLAALAAMSKFANGGIVGGNSYSGDKVLARLNSGELVLNRQQQATLFNAIKSGNLGGGGNYQFKIKGCDLIGVLQNEQKRRKG